MLPCISILLFHLMDHLHFISILQKEYSIIQKSNKNVPLKLITRPCQHSISG
ncbi:hypothetical protein Hanom_Chr15g01403171 [Helianthus anomalus]